MTSSQFACAAAMIFLALFFTSVQSVERARRKLSQPRSTIVTPSQSMEQRLSILCMYFLALENEVGAARRLRRRRTFERGCDGMVIFV